VKKVLDKIEAVRTEDLMRIAKDMFTDKTMNLAIIGPVKEDKALKEALHLQ
jgi:predicted Zn-dependent peptidase